MAEVLLQSTFRGGVISLTRPVSCLAQVNRKSKGGTELFFFAAVLLSFCIPVGKLRNRLCPKERKSIESSGD
jgi:hypothetical protein